MDRRSFLNVVAAGSVGSMAAACGSGRDADTGTDGTMNDAGESVSSGGRLIERVGLGLFSIPHMLQHDVDGTMSLLREIGYREIELFGPYPYSVPAAHDRWNSLTDALGFSQSGYFGYTPKELRAMLDRNGLSTPSMHIDLGTLRGRMDETAEAVQILGQQYAGISAIPEEERTSLDDYRRMADEFNDIGRRSVEHGFKFLYHNHGYGLAPMEGEIPLRILLDRLDPTVVALEMDIYWTVAGGADPVEYLEDYPDLYRLVHVKDMTEHVTFEGDGGDAEQWMALFPYMASVGEGVLDLGRILGSAVAVGVDHFLVERDLAPDAEAMLRGSYAYLSGLQAPA